MENADNRYVIGIDFGSTQSAVAVMRIGSREAPELIRINSGEIIPTRMAIREDDDGDPEVIAWGDIPKEVVQETEGVKIVSDFKRYLGNTDKTARDDPDADAKRNAEKYTKLFLKKLAELVRDKKEGGGELSPEKYVTCIAHPVAWSQTQINLLKRLAAEVGFPEGEEGIRTIEEPIAAMHSLRVSEDRELLFGNRSEHYLVVDFGGGTLDTCIIKTDIQNPPKIVFSAGDSLLGGKDFDAVIEKLFWTHFDGNEGDIRQKEYWKNELRSLCRNNKNRISMEISGDNKDSVRLEFPGLPGPEVSFTVTKDQLAEWSPDCWKGHFERIVGRVKKCINDTVDKCSNMWDGKIKKVILTGGSSQWFFMDKLVQEKFALSEEKIFKSGSAYTDVAIGSAVNIGRKGEPEATKGLYLRFCLNPNRKKAPEDWDWSEAKEILKPRRKKSEDEKLLEICKFEKTKYLFSQEIAFAFSEAMKPEDAAREKPKDVSIVSFFARRNAPVLQKPKNIWNAFRGKQAPGIKDGYPIYVKVKEGATLGRKNLYCIVKDASGKEILNAELISNRLSCSGWLGFGQRKEITLSKN